MTLLQSMRFPLGIVLIFWCIKLLEYFLGFDLYQLGIYPLSWQGLIGIFFAPFLHGNFQHLLSNTPTFFVLCSGLFYFYPRIAYRVILTLYVLTGAGVWLLARPHAYHIGASGLIYGFASFLFFSGVFRKDVRTLSLSLIVAFLYGGMLYGIFPQQQGVSWESHLIGAVAGANFAFYFRYAKRKHELPTQEDDIFWETLPDETEGYRPLENQYVKYTFKPTKKE